MKKKLCAALLCLTLALSAALPASALELEVAKELLTAYYVDPIPEEVLALDNLDAILEALNDQYTVYMDGEEYNGFLTSVNGDSVVGVGVSIRTAFQDGYTILSILPDSPGLEAGLEAGDRIVAVDGVTLTSSTDVQGLIAGQEGTPVTLTVVRQADGSTRDYTITRRKVDIPIVTYEQVGSAGFIDCVSFGGSTASTVRKALEELDGGVSAWIMDLRSNPGGTSNAACDTAGLFAGGGTMVFYADSFGNFDLSGTNSPDLTDKPLIILTGPYSASGSELFAAAVRDYGAGVAVGQRTFGKGIAQYVFDSSNAFGLFDGDCLKITAYRFYSPDGATNHTIGVLPTLTVSPENAERAALLLTAPSTPASGSRMKLELADQTFIVDLAQARKAENRAAFTELLEAVPPAGKVSWSTGGAWREITPANLAAILGLNFIPRTFSDVSDSPYRREIDTLAVHQLLPRYADGTFRPKDLITRAEFCEMAAQALNLPAGTGTFSDVPEDSRYAGPVSALAARGFVNGGGGTFRPDDVITCQEMAAILSRVAAWASLEGSRLSNQGLPLSEWLDYYHFSEWAQTPAWVLDQLGVPAGEQVPSDPVTRELAAGLLCTLMEQIHLIWD